jgi:phosphoribosylglycinamide formyltransferase-1
VFCNRPNAPGIEIAESFGVSVTVLNQQDFINRDAYDQCLLSQIQLEQPDLVVLAGYMRILSHEFVDYFAGRLINIHPSLLPSFPGLNTHQAALTTGVKWHGATVHFVTRELDVGPIVAQGVVPVHNYDNLDTLSDRVQAIEHIIYPKAIEWFLKDQIFLQDGIVSVIPPQSQFFS